MPMRAEEEGVDAEEEGVDVEEEEEGPACAAKRRAAPMRGLLAASGAQAPR